MLNLQVYRDRLLILRRDGKLYMISLILTEVVLAHGDHSLLPPLLLFEMQQAPLDRICQYLLRSLQLTCCQSCTQTEIALTG